MIMFNKEKPRITPTTVCNSIEKVTANILCIIFGYFLMYLSPINNNSVSNWLFFGNILVLVILMSENQRLHDSAIEICNIEKELYEH